MEVKNKSWKHLFKTLPRGTPSDNVAEYQGPCQNRVGKSQEGRRQKNGNETDRERERLENVKNMGLHYGF